MAGVLDRLLEPLQPIAIADDFEHGKATIIYGEQPDKTDDNTKLFEERFQSVLNNLLALTDKSPENAIDKLVSLANRSFFQQENLLKNLRNRTEAQLSRLANYGLGEGKLAELTGKLDNLIAGEFANLQKERNLFDVQINQLNSLYALQDFAQKLGQYGVLADLLKITPVNEEALRQQALAAGQLANLMTSSAPAYQPSTTSILFPLLGAGLGYFLGGGLGGASLGFGLGSLLGSLF